MRKLLAWTITVLTLMVSFSVNFNLGPGLSVKNVFMYLPGMVLLFQFMWGQRPKAGLQFPQVYFAVVIAYALISVVVASTVGDYRDYSLFGSLLLLKGFFFDWWVLFSVFFYGPRSVDDAEGLIKVLLIAVSIANVATLAAVGGFNILGRDDVVVVTAVVGEDSRIMGVFGHANETGTMIACLIPAYIAVIESASGIRKWAWIGCMMSSVAVMILNASRGASVGLVLGGLWGAILCRKYLSMDRAIKWVSTTAAVLIPVVLLLGIRYWDVLIARFSTTSSHGDVSTITSGRTDIWGDGLNSMMERPWSFVTGLGFNSWPSTTTLGFAPHNEYLAFWFELGLVGLFGFILMMGKTVTTALSAAAVADQKARRYMVACVASALILSIAVMFENLGMPWYFLWPYLGLMLRYASLIIADSRTAAAARSQQTGSLPQSRLARVPAIGSPVISPRRPAVGRQPVRR